MLNVLLYTTQPVLALGLTAAFEEEGDCHLASICSTTPLLLEALTRERFGVLLIEAAPEISAEMLSDIKDAAQGTPIVIWVDAVSTEFVAQAISLGVRGVLRRNLSLELQVRCLQKVGAGELWVEKTLIASLLSTKRIVLSLRERQIATLLVQGLKNKEIGYRLGLTEGTVKVYFSRLFQRVGVSDRFELALYAIRTPVGRPLQSRGNRSAASARCFGQADSWGGPHAGCRDGPPPAGCAMTGANLAGTPVWVAALCAAACRANRSDGVSSYSIQWRSGPECVRYTAIDEVTVEPFGIALAQGQILEVRWPAGDTGYRVAVRQRGSLRSCGQGACRACATG